jgi:hypothetical protein
MIDALVQAHWRERREGRGQCAQRLLEMLTRLSQEAHWLQDWFPKGRTRKTAMGSPIRPIAAELEQLLQIHRGDADGLPIDDLGFNFFAWNGEFELPVSLSITCGSYSRFVKNCVAISATDRQTMNSADSEQLKRLLDIVVEAWDPETAVVKIEEEDGQSLRRSELYRIDR